MLILQWFVFTSPPHETARFGLVFTSFALEAFLITWICIDLRTCLVKIHFTQPQMHVLSFSMMVILAVSLLNVTAVSLVKSMKPNCSSGSSIIKSSSVVKFLQSSMGELVNVRWTVVMVKSIGAANRRRWRVITSMVGVKSIYQGTLSDSARELLQCKCSIQGALIQSLAFYLLCILQK